MVLFPRFSIQRRALQLGWYSLRHGTKVFEKLNRTNIYLAKEFSNMQIFCNVCGFDTKLWYEMHSTKKNNEHKVGHLRETLECLRCLSRMRYRIMAYGLLDEIRLRFRLDIKSVAGLVGNLEKIDILDTDAYSPIAKILRNEETYKLSSYLPEKAPGLVDGENVYNVDLQNIPFPDKVFDIILSTDVMEHVRDFSRANQDIFRCLKPGGAHIFTIPFDNPSSVTKTLIDTSSSEDIYLEPPQIHGDDHLSGGIPAYRIFGMDVLDDLRNLGYEAAITRIRERRIGVFEGVYFIARRPLV